jgi:hypothetical protein
MTVTPEAAGSSPVDPANILLNSAGPRGGSRWTPFLLAMALVAVYHEGRVERGRTTIT